MGASQAEGLRPQPGGHRRRIGRAGHGLHRGGGQGEGDADRKAQDGRRLPQHRLRAVQGADQVGQAAVADEARRAIRPAASQRRVGLRGRHARACSAS